ncbi:pre-mRNA-processing protein 45 [Striga asiatica]|uniref:Pre-mRNA-processing protein 45 n=1 Tax=Striga asiatica TaxID=4170 RepID=A0A5A7RCZ2_STRAF|nr:pre-mRNA-processing protein 45 [Striga asiatica]
MVKVAVSRKRSWIFPNELDSSSSPEYSDECQTQFQADIQYIFYYAFIVKDQQYWNIPPYISNWKNPKGYTIPLDKRLAADGRGLQDVHISYKFAKLSEALYVVEQKAKEVVVVRSKVQKEMMMKEMELQELARKARSERTGVVVVPTPSEKTNNDVLIICEPLPELPMLSLIFCVTTLLF